MELEAIKKVFFIGIGGIGMSALARYLVKRGCLVSGYDKTQTNLTLALESEGIMVTYDDEVSAIPEPFKIPAEDLLVVYTPAIPNQSSILNYFKNGDFNLKKRSEVLGIISKGQFCIAVAGTHGKTTTSSIIAHLLTHSGYGCTAFLGGIASNYNSNFILGDNQVVVVEADEYDRSFLTLHPSISVITSMDADHLDIYGDADQLNETFQLFAKQLKADGTLFVKAGLPIHNCVYYGVQSDAQHHAKNIRVLDGNFVFDYEDKQTEIKDLSLLLPGKHNIENAVAAIAVALKLGISTEKIKDAVATFKGVKRRFEYQVRTAEHIYIDDYAHHPEELKACFDAVRQLYPDKTLTVIFQPHLYTRTRDFAAGFAEVLSTVDELLLLDIYPARELPLEGIDSNFLLEKLTLKNAAVYSKKAALEDIKHKRPALLLTVGAGDIDTMVQPLKELLGHA
ncbi:UDP-N-acetylmuramate--L-alanine ligase [Pedobacter sp.]|uniref:UDP-N-acetylmuramate--L-alanine ligase n=1 Tax=Pedobacter sp. TaxID=1411316 RepID=UPI003D7F3EF5